MTYFHLDTGQNHDTKQLASELCKKQKNLIAYYALVIPMLLIFLILKNVDKLWIEVRNKIL